VSWPRSDGLFLRHGLRQSKVKSAPQLFVTLCPSFPHFGRFAKDGRLSGIRLNSAMLTPEDLDREITLAKGLPVPLWFDIKGRQMRIAEVIDNPDYLDIRLNHPIKVPTPTVVLLKAGADQGLLGELREDGRRLVFSGNPTYRVISGESIHIRDPKLEIGGPLFSDLEFQKIEKVRNAGVRRWFLSYVEEQGDIDRLREVVGKNDDIMLKIESKRGLSFVQNKYRRDDHTRLVAACGDLYVEIQPPS
jgi:hypothetical protein